MVLTQAFLKLKKFYLHFGLISLDFCNFSELFLVIINSSLHEPCPSFTTFQIIYSIMFAESFLFFSSIFKTKI